MKMRKLILIAGLGLATVVGLSACNKEEKAPTQQVAPTKPASAANKAGWKNFLIAEVRQHMDGVTSKPFLYFVPGGDDGADRSARENQQQKASDDVARTVLAGTMLAYGGPSSAKTADLIIQAFDGAKPGAFNGVIVLFIGDKADEQRVADAIAPSGATLRFVQM
ncbi:MAG: hypothetical protein WCD66_11245 [Rhodanobacteraceae bacterium]